MRKKTVLFMNITYLNVSLRVLFGLRKIKERKNEKKGYEKTVSVVILPLLLILLTLFSAKNLSTSQGACLAANAINLAFASLTSLTLAQYLF